MGYKYRFTGRTQYQSQQAADEITRSTQSVNRVAGDRFTWDRTLDPGMTTTLGPIVQCSAGEFSSCPLSVYTI